MFRSSPHSYWLLLKHSFIGHQIEETLRAAGKSQLLTRLSYPGAGHLIEPPYTPNSRASMWSTKPKKREPQPNSAKSYFILVVIPFLTRLFIVIEYVLLWTIITIIMLPCVLSPAVITLWGGHLAAHAAAQEDAWKKILDFMECNLRRWIEVLRQKISQHKCDCEILDLPGRVLHAENWGRKKNSVVYRSKGPRRTGV